MTTDIVAPFRSERADLLLGEHGSDLAVLASKVAELRSRLDSIEINSDADARLVNDMIAGAKMASEKLEKDRESRKRPILEEGRSLDSLYRPATQAFEEMKRQAQRKLRHYLERKQEEAAAALAKVDEAKRKAEEEREEAIRRAGEASTEGEKKAAEAEIVGATQELIKARQDMPLDSMPTSVRSEYAHSQMHYRTAVRIRDLSKVPREFLEAALKSDSKLEEGDTRFPSLERVIMPIAKAGGEPPHGVEFFENPTIRTTVGLQ